MGQVLESERPLQSYFKAESPHFSETARLPGVYKTRARTFCLPEELSVENLCPDIRQAAPTFFTKHAIKWHDAQQRNPSNHMCDSQVCCVNFLYPFADKPEALAALLRPIFPSLERIAQIDGQYVTFEWIGLENYLKEKISHNGTRTRGANFTSPDAAVVFDRTDGLRHIVLIERKYTESYGGADLSIAASGTDQRDIYRWLYEDPCCPLDRSLIPSFNPLFVEPFYQLMRQQFLAWRMELANELGANVVSVLHIAPRANADFLRVTSPGLAHLGSSPTAIWARLVNTPGRFHSVFTEDLFGQFPIQRFADLAPWWHYVNQRYSWLLSTP